MVICFKKRALGVLCILSWFLVVFSVAEGASLSIPLGLVMEHNFYTQFGISVSVSSNNFLNGHPAASFCVTSSRLASLAGYNVLKKENCVLNASWHFRPGKYVNPFAGVDFGWTSFDLENKDIFGKIKNSAPLVNIRTGIGTMLLAGRLIPRLDCGVAIIQSSTVFPLFFGISLCYDVMSGGAK